MPRRLVLSDRDELLRLNPNTVGNIKRKCDFGSPNRNECWMMRRSSIPNPRWVRPHHHSTIKVHEKGTRTQFYTHRISWVLQNGSIDPDKWIRHQCHNPRCINPSHLLLGSARGNRDDRTVHEMLRNFLSYFGKRPNYVTPPISLWAGWELPEHQAYFERLLREVEAAVAADAAAEDAAAEEAAAEEAAAEDAAE